MIDLYHSVFGRLMRSYGVIPSLPENLSLRSFLPVDKHDIAGFVIEGLDMPRDESEVYLYGHYAAAPDRKYILMFRGLAEIRDAGDGEPSGKDSHISAKLGFGRAELPQKFCS